MNAVNYYIIKSIMQDWKYFAGVSVNKAGKPENIYAVKERMRHRTKEYLTQANELEGMHTLNFNIKTLEILTLLKKEIDIKIAKKNEKLYEQSEITLLNNEKVPLKDNMFKMSPSENLLVKYNYNDIIHGRLNYMHEDSIIVCDSLIGGIIKNQSAEQLKNYSFDWILVALYSSMKNYEKNNVSHILKNIGYTNLKTNQKEQLFEIFLNKMYEEEDIIMIEDIIKIYPESILYFDNNFNKTKLVEEDEDLESFIKEQRVLYEKSQLTHIQSPIENRNNTIRL